MVFQSPFLMSYFINNLSTSELVNQNFAPHRLAAWQRKICLSDQQHDNRTLQSDQQHDNRTLQSEQQHDKRTTATDSMTTELCHQTGSITTEHMLLSDWQHDNRNLPSGGLPDNRTPEYQTGSMTTEICHQVGCLTTEHLNIRLAAWQQKFAIRQAAWQQNTWISDWQHDNRNLPSGRLPDNRTHKCQTSSMTTSVRLATWQQNICHCQTGSITEHLPVSMTTEHLPVRPAAWQQNTWCRDAYYVTTLGVRCDW